MNNIQLLIEQELTKLIPVQQKAKNIVNIFATNTVDLSGAQVGWIEVLIKEPPENESIDIRLNCGSILRSQNASLSIIEAMKLKNSLWRPSTI